MAFYCPQHQKEGFVCFNTAVGLILTYQTLCVLGIVLKIERCHMYLDIKMIFFMKFCQ